jgi:hypothetical protein
MKKNLQLIFDDCITDNIFVRCKSAKMLTFEIWISTSHIPEILWVQAFTRNTYIGNGHLIRWYQSNMKQDSNPVFHS